MFSLKLVVRPVFATLENVSLERVLRYYDTTIARMAADSLGGKLTDRLTASQAIRTQFFGSATAAEAALTFQKGLTDQVEALIERMSDDLSDRYEGVIRGTFGRSSEAYMSFFPYGLTEYGDATRELMPGLVQRLHDAVATYQTDLPPAVVTALQSYKTAWEALRDEQLQGIGHTDAEADKVAKARAAVYHQQYLNLHYLCYVLEGDEARILHYFDDSILAPRRRTKAEGEEEATDPTT